MFIRVMAALAFLCVAAPAASAQHVLDPAQVMAGADRLDLQTFENADRDPLPELGAEFATLTQYSNERVDGGSQLPWGDILSELLKALGALIGAAVLYVLAKLPKPLTSALDMFAGMLGQGRANELLEKAVNYGINTTAGAVKGKTLSIKIGNEVLERSFEYAVRHAPTLIEMLGGMAQLREKIIARLDLEESAALPSARPSGATGIGGEAMTAPPPPPSA